VLVLKTTRKYAIYFRFFSKTVRKGEGLVFKRIKPSANWESQLFSVILIMGNEREEERDFISMLYSTNFRS
jgi:hypothetical protein